MQSLRDWMATLASRPDVPAETVDVAAIFEAAMRLERGAADLYRGMAARLSHVAGASAFFESMAVGEDAHYRALQFSRRILLGSGIYHVTIPLDLHLMRDYTRWLERAESLAEQPDLTLSNALGLACALESSEIDAMTRVLLSLPTHPVVQAMLADMQREATDHVESLRGYVRHHAPDLLGSIERIPVHTTET